MQGKLRTFWKYTGYTLFTILLTIYFLLLSFPYDALKDRLLAQWEATLPFQISV